MRAVLMASLALGGTVACTPADRDQVTRSAARSIVTRVVIDQFPNAPVEPVLDCIIANASAPELAGLASDSLTGPTAATTQTVLGISGRAPTRTCLATRGVAIPHRT